jgi:hypothetical protein
MGVFTVLRDFPQQICLRQPSARAEDSAHYDLCRHQRTPSQPLSLPLLQISANLHSETPAVAEGQVDLGDYSEQVRVLKESTIFRSGQQYRRISTFPVPKRPVSPLMPPTQSCSASPHIQRHISLTGLPRGLPSYSLATPSPPVYSSAHTQLSPAEKTKEKVQKPCKQFSTTTTQLQACEAENRISTYLRLMVSNWDTAVMLVAMSTRTKPPATTEFSRFFSEGVTEASATRGLHIMVAMPATTPAGRASSAFSCFELQPPQQLVLSRAPPSASQNTETAALPTAYLATTVRLTRHTILLEARATAVARGKTTLVTLVNTLHEPSTSTSFTATAVHANCKRQAFTRPRILKCSSCRNPRLRGSQRYLRPPRTTCGPRRGSWTPGRRLKPEQCSWRRYSG